jgi:hypothetical protein
MNMDASGVDDGGFIGPSTMNPGLTRAIAAVSKQGEEFRILECCRAQIDEKAGLSSLGVQRGEGTSRLAYDPAVDGGQQSRVLGRSHEFAGVNQLAMSADQTQQDFEIFRRVAVQVDDGLIGELKAVFFESGFEANLPVHRRRHNRRFRCKSAAGISAAPTWGWTRLPVASVLKPERAPFSADGCAGSSGRPCSKPPARFRCSCRLPPR